MKYLKIVFVFGYGIAITAICFEQLGSMKDITSIDSIERGIYLGIFLLIIGFPASILVSIAVWLLVSILSLFFPDIKNANTFQWIMMGIFTYIGGVVQWLFVFPFLIRKLKDRLSRSKD